MEPKVAAISWADFCQNEPPFSIALDGIVPEPTQFDLKGPWANFNHHEGVDRLATRSTCAQVLLAIRSGLFKTFRNSGEPCANVYANDCDQDVCVTWALLHNFPMVTNTINPLVNRLVFFADMMDCTAGTYPFPNDLALLQQMAWVFEPYTTFRSNNSLARRVAEEFVSVVENVELRILRHLVGGSDCLQLDQRYQIIGGGKDWKMVTEIGAYARHGMAADGINAFVSAAEIGDGRFRYSIGRTSIFIPFDVPRILVELNKVEGNTNGDHWGGSNIIGGSPRVSGSKLPPNEVERIINELPGQAG